ncbi:Cytochrome oxidase Cu insertion factor, SCO1/SenC/PrrC family [Halalkaliarchaeum sp. AArc-CO]|uniref:SCO family protein n=1 Tax=unclassified Halalkaliarchaeum TaxID=2678344 RepID=UPI00217D41FE|nr:MULTISPECIES: SCO family protein [unclassified Halalkaliarchaeum]MDR5673956.1 SCO family protein [Halalkaliarchaeum sp. AArc-GB]UWG50592.1 Cytochrome oxidase Cu insertion factor, SCO1/SenC/PrrC family [Halalkaliarchaeum sp. AArc-CO]
MNRPTSRRGYLATVGAVGLGGALAGCLGDDDTVLGPPEDQDAESEALSFPAYGQRLPEATLPSPLHDREVTTTEFEGNRETLVTFVFTRCSMVCPALTGNLAQVQAHAAEGGFEDEIALVPITFDPVYDTPEVLREYSEYVGADPTAENWQFLRPESEERAREVVAERFGVGYEKTDAYTPNEESEEMEFVHTSVTVLANRDGYVERGYNPGSPSPARVIDDLDTVREGYR